MKTGMVTALAAVAFAQTALAESQAKRELVIASLADAIAISQVCVEASVVQDQFDKIVMIHGVEMQGADREKIKRRIKADIETLRLKDQKIVCASAKTLFGTHGASIPGLLRDY